MRVHGIQTCELPTKRLKRYRNTAWICSVCGQAWLTRSEPAERGYRVEALRWRKWPFADDADLTVTTTGAWEIAG